MTAEQNPQNPLDLKLLSGLIKGATIAHSAFKEGRVRLDRCVERREAGLPTCIAVVGDSGSGKTHLVRDLKRRHRTSRSSEGLTSPILYVTTPAKPTLKGFAQQILDALGDKLCTRGSETEVTRRIRRLLKETGVIMLVLDEFQQLYHNVTERVMYETCDWLKNLIDMTGVVLVVTGLPDCMTVISMNEQLTRRFEAPIEIARFEWEKTSGNAEFAAVLKAFHTALSSHLDLPDLGTPEMAFRFFCASGGLMGYVTKILLRAVELVCASGQQYMNLGILHKAYMEEVWKDAAPGVKDLMPFSESFEPLVSDGLLERVRQVGTASSEVPRRRGARRRTKTSEKLGVDTSPEPLKKDRDRK